MVAIGKIILFMDSIELVTMTSGKSGQECKVSVNTGEIYSGLFHGYCESTKEFPLTLRLYISGKEAARIGLPWLREIGIPYDVIDNISF